jgi:hypothetical protein
MQPAYFYYQIIRDVCIDMGCEMVPVHSCWDRHIREQGLMHKDLLQKNVLHPNERGHAIFAEVMINRLELIVPAG